MLMFYFVNLNFSDSVYKVKYTRLKHIVKNMVGHVTSNETQNITDTTIYK